ncbi:MAG: type II toxin-antitoxin system VapC family toxin [Xenococcaceae cyanobacterium MO_207.B15]|nr:type II toxin-antitoxin system VapC family toxin [Xenococcaceae cyanobacterium MO_207.B15]
MIYLLDTCTLSDYLKGESNTIKKFHQTKPHDICLSSITIFEIDYGLQLKPSLIKKINPQLQAIYQKVKIIDFSPTEAKAAANIRSNLKQAGTPIGYYDLLIAATAQVNNLTLVTSNTQEFSRVQNLQLENWRL